MGLNFDDQQRPAMPNHGAISRAEFPMGAASAPAPQPELAAPTSRIQEGTPGPVGVTKSIFDVVADIVHAPNDALQAGKTTTPASAKMAQTPPTAPKSPGLDFA
ncbi:MAG: hypothetical protein WBK91_06435 [Alphaproteobacteria bacterium]